MTTGTVFNNDVQNETTYKLDSAPKTYRRQLSHDGAYAAATLMINNESLSANPDSCRLP